MRANLPQIRKGGLTMNARDDDLDQIEHQPLEETNRPGDESSGLPAAVSAEDGPEASIIIHGIKGEGDDGRP